MTIPRAMIVLWTIRRYILAAAFSLCLPISASAVQGGSGVVRTAMGTHCLQAKASRVLEVCGDFSVRWRIDVLVGEPIEDYFLTWNIESVRLSLPDTGATQKFPIDSLPSPLAKAASNIEISLKALGWVAGNRTVAVAIDTGAPVRPGKTASFNVTGSPNWQQWLIVAQREQTGRGMDAWCQVKGRTYSSSAEAKRQMLVGIRLNSLQLCQDSIVDATWFELALSKFCEEYSGNHQVCPKSGRDSIASALDRGADKPLIDRKLSDMTARFREESVRACSAHMNEQAQCLIQAGCNEIRGPSSAVCESIPRRPSDWFRGPFFTSSSGPCDAKCRAAFDKRIQDEDARERAKAREAQSRWDAQWQTTQERCSSAEHAAERRAYDQCRQKSLPKCSPNGETADQCLAIRMRNAPSVFDAKLLVEREIDDRAKKPTRPSFLD